MDNDGTYGGITRSDAVACNVYYAQPSGQLTVEMLQDAFKAIERMDEQTRQLDMKFAKEMQRFNHFVKDDAVAYIAAYRLVRACVYMECALHPKNAEEYIGILKSRGIEF